MNDLIAISQEEYDALKNQASFDGELTPVGWIVPDDLTYDRWFQIGEALSFFGKGQHWWVGDWVNAGEGRWGERYAQAIDETRFVYGTLATDAWVCRKIPFSSRDERLSFTHHRYAAIHLDKLEEIEIALDECAAKEWSTREFQSHLKGEPERRVDRLDKGVSFSGQVYQPQADRLDAAPSTVTRDTFTGNHRHSSFAWKEIAKTFWKRYTGWKRRALMMEGENDELRKENALQFAEIQKLSQELDEVRDSGQGHTWRKRLMENY